MRDVSGGLRVTQRARITIHKNALPELQIEQTPDAIAVVANSAAVFDEQRLDRVGLKKSALQRAWPGHGSLNLI